MTDGGNEATPGPLGSDAPWPAPPPGVWSATPATPAPPRPPTGSRRRTVETLVVVLLTGAIVALAFTALDGDPNGSAAESRFRTVGSSIDSSDPGLDPGTDEWDTIPELQDLDGSTGGLYDALPTYEDVEDLVELSGGRANLQVEEIVGLDPASPDCADDAPEPVDGVRRVWSLDDSMSEVEVRIDDLGSVEDAQLAVERRQTPDFLECLPTEVETDDGSGIDAGVVVDTSTVDRGDRLEQLVLVDDGEQTALYAWRQVDQYVITIKAFDFVWGSAGYDLDLAAMDDLLALTTELLDG